MIAIILWVFVPIAIVIAVFFLVAVVRMGMTDKPRGDERREWWLK